MLGQVLSGQPRLRKTMSCSRGTWDDLAADRYAVTYQWLRDSVAIAGRPATTYDVVGDRHGHSISCQTRAETRTPTNPVNGAETVRAPAEPDRSRASAACPRAPPAAQLHDAATGTTRTTDRYSVTYTWFRGNTADPEPTTPTYTTRARGHPAEPLLPRPRRGPDRGAVGRDLRSAGPTTSSAPQITGDPRLFRTLELQPRRLGRHAADRYAVTYSWFRNSVAIPGATSANYTVGHDDMNKSLYCRVRAEDNLDANTGAVYPDLPRAIVPPQISGQPHLRGELTCTRGTWDDTPEHRYAVSYQWYRSGTPISGATDPAYVLGTADLNRYITCRGDGRGAARQRRRQPVRVRPVRHRRGPAIEGIAHPRRELTCTRGEWNDSPANPYVLTYQWRRNNTPIPGADGPDHIVVAEDVGSDLHCAVTAEGTHTACVLVRVPDLGAAAARADCRTTTRTGAERANAYTLRVRNDNPVPVTITQLELTMPGGFSYRPGTTTGALTIDPTLTGAGLADTALDRRLPASPRSVKSVVRVGVTAGSATR